MELLDDPIPDSLYCKPCRDKNGKSKPLDLEGNPSIDTFASSTQCSLQEVVLTSEPMPVTACNQHRLDSFNISTEVDRCDLWRNMVKRLDSSPEVARGPEEEVGGVCPVTTEGAGDCNEREWHPSLTFDNKHRTLGTLEECENEMESPAQDSPSMPKFGSFSSPSYVGAASPPPSNGGVTPSSRYHERWRPNAPHEPWYGTVPVPYQSTAV